MTITYYDKMAILPKRCNKCNRLFWLEPYNIFYKCVGVGIDCYSLKKIKCINCIIEEESEERDERPYIH